MMAFQTVSKLRSAAAVLPMATINAILDGFLNLPANLRYGYVNLRAYDGFHGVVALMKSLPRSSHVYGIVYDSVRSYALAQKFDFCQKSNFFGHNFNRVTPSCITQRSV